MDLAEAKKVVGAYGVEFDAVDGAVQWLIAEVERLTEEDAAHKEFMVTRVKVLAQKLDCTEGLPDDSTIYGCLGSVLGMFRRRVEVLTTDHAKALTRSKAEGRREGMEDLVCYMIDNCERETITEEYLQGVLSDCIRFFSVAAAIR